MVRGRAHLRTLYVVLFSLYFYYKLSGLYLLLLLFVALMDYLIGRRVYSIKQRGGSGGGWVALSVVINVTILVYFKATNFFVDLVNGLYAEGTLDWESVVVPAGVSFKHKHTKPNQQQNPPPTKHQTPQTTGCRYR